MNGSEFLGLAHGALRHGRIKSRKDRTFYCQKHDQKRHPQFQGSGTRYEHGYSVRRDKENLHPKDTECERVNMPDQQVCIMIHLNPGAYRFRARHMK